MYNRAWERLRRELRELRHQEVRSIDPEVILSFMGFIEQAEAYEAALEVARKQPGSTLCKLDKE